MNCIVNLPGYALIAACSDLLCAAFVSESALVGLFCCSICWITMQWLFPDPQNPPSRAMMQRRPNLYEMLRHITIELGKKKTGPGSHPGWSYFQWYFDPASLVEGVVFGSGHHGGQELPIELNRAVGNTWWPCILSNQVQIPWIWVRCEPLILDGSRPWKTHISRVRVFDGAGNPIPIGTPSPQPPPPATAPPPPAWLISSTVQIEELEEETASTDAVNESRKETVTTAAIADLVTPLPACCSFSRCFEVMTEESQWGWYCSLDCFKQHAFELTEYEVVSC